MESISHKRLGRKISGMAIFFAIVPITILGLTIYYLFHMTYSSRILDDLKDMAENRKNTINIFLEERTSQLYLLAKAYQFDELKTQEGLEAAFASLQKYSRSFVDLGIIDANGLQLAYTGPYNLKGLNYSDQEWFNSAIVNDKHISDVFMGFRKVPHLIITVRGWNGNLPWILRATINSEVFDHIVSSTQTGRKGDAFIINSNGLLQTKTRFENVLERSRYAELLKNGPGTRVAKDTFDNEEELLATTWLKDNQWLLVIKLSSHEELSPLFTARAVCLIVYAISIIGGILSSVIITRLMINKLIQSEREKAELDDRLIQSAKMAALGKLAAGVAHEVNNPLAVIKEQAGWIKDLLEEEDIAGSKNFKEFEDSLNKIDQHVNRARKVTHRLLGFARKMEPVNEKVNVNLVLEETISFLANEAKHNNIVILPSFLKGLPQIMSDASQLQQVFLNLLNNAIDAIGNNGEVKIQTTYNSIEKYVAILFIDNGPGIPADVKKKIFDPFFTTRGVGQGTGLGLSISFSIIEKLGGTITVDSQPGHGAVFTIKLPMNLQGSLEKYD